MYIYIYTFIYIYIYIHIHTGDTRTRENALGAILVKVKRFQWAIVALRLRTHSPFFRF